MTAAEDEPRKTRKDCKNWKILNLFGVSQSAPAKGHNPLFLHVAIGGALLWYAKTFDALGISFLINVKEISDLFPAHLQGNPSKERFLQVPIRMKTPLIERNI